MTDQGELYEKSWILHHVLERFIGTPEVIETRRRNVQLREYVYRNTHTGTRLLQIFTGSSCEGIQMEGSDRDAMLVETTVEVICANHDSSYLRNSKDKTVLIMRNAPNSRPGYVTLELVKLEPRRCIERSIVPNGDHYFISSELLRQHFFDIVRKTLKSSVVTHGPAVTYNIKHNSSKTALDSDMVIAFSCTQWPPEAYEWVSRPRLHGWPDKALRDQIVQGGCHVVPVGDRTSDDTFLQWRISFTVAEQKLVRSLTHAHFLIYGLHKYFLKQISDRLKQIFGDEDVLSSYIIKTVIFHAAENTPGSLWQEKNTFLCFMICFKILIGWVKAGYCPNHFVSNNNMFLGKVQGENQQKLLYVLVELYNMNWKCLSVGTAIQPSIGKQIDRARNGAWKQMLGRPTQSEMICDVNLCQGLFERKLPSNSLPALLSSLSKSKSDLDEFIAYITTVRALSYKGMSGFKKFKKSIPAKGNKEKYKHLRKSKALLQPLSSVCTSPGQLTLATYYYQTGNYRKALEMCRDMVSSFKLYFGIIGNEHDNDTRVYENLYCGSGHTLLHKCKSVYAGRVSFPWDCKQFCPTQLHLELKKCINEFPLSIPPLPYAVFLTFLCHHKLGDTRRRGEALVHLQAVKYDERQGIGDNWIVHNILGICHEVVGDTRQALREYEDSLRSQAPFQHFNCAEKRIRHLKRSYRSTYRHTSVHPV